MLLYRRTHLHSIFFIKFVISIIVYTALYLGFNSALSQWTSNPELIAFMLIMAFNLAFDRFLRIYFSHYLQRPFSFYLAKEKEILRTLNNKLVEVVRYQEIKRLLFSSFESLLKETPHVFYIWDKDHYYLSNYAYVKNAPTLPPTINESYLENISGEHINLEKHLILPEHKLKAFKATGLSEIFLFPGHNHIFAFMLTTKKARVLLRRPPLQYLFQRVQHKLGLILENSSLFIGLKRSNFEMKKVVEVSGNVLSSLETKSILDYILDALSTLVSFDAAAMFLLDADGETLKSTSSVGYKDDSSDLLNLKVGQGAAGHVVQTKKIDVIDNVDNAEHYWMSRPETRSQISLPLIFDNVVLGVVCVESNVEGFFNKHKIELLRMFANLAAIGIHNALQVDIRLSKQAYELELLNAATVQKSLLISAIPTLEKLSITAENLPSKMVSGDLYDFCKVGSNTVGVAIGDVSGKGAPAALMMTLVLAGFRSQFKTSTITSDVINRLNDLLTQTTIEGKYTTFFYGLINLEEKKIIYTNAGHNPPYLIKKDGRVITMAKGGIVLGFMESQNYIQESIDFEPGDIFIAFTDGVSETMNGLEEEFGEERIIALVTAHRDKSIYEIKRIMHEALNQFSNGATPADDLTLILAKHD